VTLTRHDHHIPASREVERAFDRAASIQLDCHQLGAMFVGDS
jgi:hypothetical protein